MGKRFKRTPPPFERRFWVDYSELLPSVRHKDREAVGEVLKKEAGPLIPPAIERVPYVEETPEPQTEEQTAAKPITGWQFVAAMREASTRPTPPNDLQHIWPFIEFDFNYTLASEHQHMVVTTDGLIRVAPHHQLPYDEWMFSTWHLVFHLALDCLHPPADTPDVRLWQLACEHLINVQVNQTTRLAIPLHFVAPRLAMPRSPFSGLPFSRQRANSPITTVNQQLKKWADDGVKLEVKNWRTPSGWRQWDVEGSSTQTSQHYRSLYVLSQVQQLQPQPPNRAIRYAETDAARAHRWFVESFPLLSSAAAEFQMDYESAPRRDIGIAAVNAVQQIIYVNLNAGLTEMEWRFVIGHEILHVVLEHHQRLGDRDPMVWNLACDYVINNWLVQMGVGVCPPKGGLYKKEYAGKDAETIYKELMENGGNDQLQLESFRGNGKGDILDFDKPGSGNGSPSRFRPNVRQMTQNAARKIMEDKENGLMRGDLPGDLIEELDLGSMNEEKVTIPEWKAELAEWFRVQFTPKPPRRSYARQSRRQNAVPEIPRPGMAALDFHSPSFGVVVDSSGSMSHELLQKGLAALVAFSELHGVAVVRLVMCDTRPFDEGFIPVDKLKKPYRIWGRGGTVLQPGVELLQKAKDFPEDAPILVITDGAIDVLSIEREHAFLLPGNGQLPFEPKGPVFRILGENRGGLFGRPFARPGDNTANNEPNNNERPRFGGFRPRGDGEASQPAPKRSPFRKPRNADAPPPSVESADQQFTDRVRGLIDRIKKL